MNGSQLYCILLDMLLPAGQEDDLQVRESLVVQELLLRIYKQFERKYCHIVGKLIVLCGCMCVFFPKWPSKVKALIGLSFYFSITGIVFTLIKYNWHFTKPRPPTDAAPVKFLHLPC